MWHNIGLELGISSGSLDSIEASANQNPGKCMTDMIKDWLNSGTPQPTWAALVEALKSPMVGLGDLSKKLAMSHKHS